MDESFGGMLKLSEANYSVMVQPFISDSLQFRDDIIWKTISSILMWVIGRRDAYQYLIMPLRMFLL